MFILVCKKQWKKLKKTAFLSELTEVNWCLRNVVSAKLIELPLAHYWKKTPLPSGQLFSSYREESWFICCLYLNGNILGFLIYRPIYVCEFLSL